ncbi:MAG TPA: phosphotransferase family protein [Acidimicrobiales bacterium]
MRQPAEDRALYYRQLRRTIATVFAPELTSATAKDAAGLVDRILAEFVLEEEWAAPLSQEYGVAFEALLFDAPRDVPGDEAVTPERFVELRRLAADLVAAKAGSDDPAERLQCRRLVDVERRYLERVDELRQAVLREEHTPDASASPTECSVTADELTAYLRRRFPDSPDLRVTELAVVPGGRSKETLLVSLTGTTELPKEVIVRKDRPIGLLATKASDEFAILRAVHDHGGVPVARPLFADESFDTGSGGVGTLLVMERVRGEKAGEYFPDLAMPPEEYRHAIGTQLATALAHLHAVPLDSLAGTGFDLDAQVNEGTLSAAVNGMAARISELSGPPIAAVPLARQWLLDHIDDVVPSGPLSLLQGDFGLHNTLVEGERVTALVDWEAATIGPPARELAAAWPAATALMEWPTFIATYCAAGGSVEATDEWAVTYYRVFFGLGACLSSRTGGHLFRTGDKRDLLTAHSGLDSHFRAQRNLVRALADAEALTGES